MNPVPFILLAISLPLLLGGCNEKESDEGISSDKLHYREDLMYNAVSDTSYTGESFKLYDNGEKRFKGNFKEGKRQGLWTWWNKNGQKKKEENYKDGKLDGLAVDWHENGQKREESNYKDGRLDGLAVDWHENGQKKKGESWKNGEFVEGSENFWNSKGEPVDSLEETE